MEIFHYLALLIFPSGTTSVTAYASLSTLMAPQEKRRDKLAEKFGRKNEAYKSVPGLLCSIQMQEARTWLLSVA